MYMYMYMCTYLHIHIYVYTHLGFPIQAFLERSDKFVTASCTSHKREPAHGTDYSTHMTQTTSQIIEATTHT